MSGGTGTGDSRCHVVAFLLWLCGAPSTEPGLSATDYFVFRAWPWVLLHPNQDAIETITTDASLSGWGAVAEPDSSGAVACSGPLRAYQCSGVVGCARGIAVFSALPGRPACACAVGQCLDRLSHKPPGRHQVCTTVAGIPGSLVVGSTMPGQPESNAESGCKLTIRLQTYSPVASLRRTVAASPGGGSQHLECPTGRFPCLSYRARFGILTLIACSYGSGHCRAEPTAGRVFRRGLQYYIECQGAFYPGAVREQVAAVFCMVFRQV